MTKFGIAQPVRRVEDPRLLKGAGRYTDDIVLPGMAWSARGPQPARRRPHPRHRHRRREGRPRRARRLHRMPTSPPTASAACPASSRSTTATARRARTRRTRCSPTAPCAMSATPSPSSSPKPSKPARDGAEADRRSNTTSCRPSPTSAAAMDPGAPLVWPRRPGQHRASTGRPATRRRDRGAVRRSRPRHPADRREQPHRRQLDGGARRARRATTATAAGRCTPTPRAAGCIKDLLGGQVFKVGPDKFRIVTPDVGGGFGMKLFLYAEHVLTCYAARKLGRPVKWTSDAARRSCPTRMAATTSPQGEIALDEDGKFLALRTRNVANMGAYLSHLSRRSSRPAPAPSVLASVYGFQAVYANVIGVFTNTVPVDAYRGAGRPESNYLVERLIDTAARELGIDRDRAAPPQHGAAVGDAVPHARWTRLYDSGDFQRVLDAALREDGLGRLRGAAAPRASARGKQARHRHGLLPGGDRRRPTASAPKSASPMTASSMSMSAPSRTGQGHETAYVQLTADRLGIDGDKIRIRQGDTDTHPDRRRHRRRAQPVFRGPGHPGHRRQRDREGQAGGRPRRWRPRSPTSCSRTAASASSAPTAASTSSASPGAAQTGRRRRGRRHPRRRRGREDRRPHLPEWLPHGRGRGRSRDRHRSP